MADNTWDASTDSDANTPANWSLNRVPTGTDVAVYNSAVTNTSCNLSGNISCQGIKFANAYTGKIDGVASNWTLGSDGLLCTNGGSAELDLGSGTWTCSGDWDTADIGTFNRGTSTLVLSVAGTSANLHDDQRVANLVISAAGTVSAYNAAFIGATLTINSGAILSCSSFQTYGSSVIVNGKLDCNGSVYMNTAVVSGNGTIDAISMYLGGLISVGPLSSSLTFDIDTLIQFTTGSSATFTPDSGTYSIPCNLKFFADGNLTVACETSNPSWSVGGDVDFVEGAGTLTWTKGTGTITFDGTSDQDANFLGNAVEDIRIEKDSDTAKVRLTGNVTTDAFNGTRGRFDLDGNTLTSIGNVIVSTGLGFQFHNGTDNDMDGGIIDIDGGNLLLSGISGVHLEINNLDFVMAAGVSGSAVWCDVINSTATGDNDISATSNCEDDGGNSGWDFGEGVTVAFVGIATGGMLSSLGILTGVRL